MNHVYKRATAHTQLKDKSEKVKARIWRERQTETEKQKEGKKIQETVDYPPTWDVEGYMKP